MAHHEPEGPWSYNGKFRRVFQDGTPVLTAALFTIAKTWEPPQSPLPGKRIKKMWCIYTVGYYSVIKKNGIMPSQQHD